MSWASQRQATYISGIMLVIIVTIGIIGFYLFYDAPTCFDGKENGDEDGIDCGGSCELVCSFQAIEPVVVWSRVFEVFPGTYSAVAIVENRNVNAFAEDVSYVFTLRDEDGLLVYERKGKTYIPPQTSTFAVFESNIVVPERVPTKSFFEFTHTPEWKRVEEALPNISFSQQRLYDEGNTARLSAVVTNEDLNDIRRVDIVAVLYGLNGNAIATSKTFIEDLQGGESSNAIFTWPEAFGTELVQCESPVDVMLLLDTSGSMNDDSENPPQPLTDTKNAAASFLNKLREDDTAGVVSFASNATLESSLSSDINSTQNAVLSLEILPEEESGATNIGDAIRTAQEQLKLFTSENRQSAMVLLTDGKANAPEVPGGEAYANTHALLAKNAGIRLYTIGLGKDVNALFLESLASDGERFYQAPTTESLNGIYTDISEDLCENPSVVRVEFYPIISSSGQ